MSDEKYCPFWFAAPHHEEFYCIKSKCALWVDDGENSCCGLTYQARRQIANREKNRREREEFRKRYREKWGL